MRKEKNIGIIGKGIMIILVIFLLASFVNAFGVASSYWKGNPVTISPGETKTISLGLQNMVGTEDVTLKAVLKEGAGIASVEEKTYFVKAGTKNTEVPIRVSIPDNAEIDTPYLVTVSFQTVTSGDGAAVVIGTGIDTSFDVLVVPLAPVIEPTGEGVLGGDTFDEGNLLMIVVLIALIILIIIIYKRRKRTRELRELKKNNRR